MTASSTLAPRLANAPEWNPAPVPEAAEVLAEAGYGRLAPLLARRGVATPAEAERFLSPDPRALHDPFGLHGMEEAVKRLLEAAREEGTVAVVGDYDVDGVSACALVTAVLQSLGARVLPLIPNRFTDGYGFQETQVERARSEGAEVILTVDCGTSSTPAIESAVASGMDVIVTDHHLPGDDFPDSAIQINPHQDGCSYEFGGLSGAGLALKLAQGLYRRSGRSEPLEALLRVACLGTIADVVPLVGENRVIAALGLRALQDARSHGLKALMKVAAVRGALTSEAVGFRIGPRINAAGRLKDASLALDLLLCRDADQAKKLAEELDELNRKRQSEERRVVDAARASFAERDPLPGILVAWDETWSRGVVGIAAGRLAREFHRPVILLGLDGESATGSGRSIPDVNLHEFVSGFADRLARFGGHRQAIGLTVEATGLEDLRTSLEEAARWPAEALIRRYSHELELAADDVDTNLYRELARLEPHGEANRKPLIRIGPLKRAGTPRHFGSDHVSLPARDPERTDGRPVRLLGWRWKKRLDELGGRFEVLGRLAWDGYLGQPVLELEDARQHPGRTDGGA